MAPADALGVGTIHDDSRTRDAFDRRGSVAAVAAQRAAAERLGARVSWGRFGAPRSVFKADGWLAEGLEGTPEAAAREFLRRNAALFGDVSGLSCQRRPPHRLGRARRALPPRGRRAAARGRDGGRRHSSTAASATRPRRSAGAGRSRARARLSGQEAWRAAARNAGVDAGACPCAARGRLRPAARGGLAPLQQVREVAVATGGGFRRAFEANVVDNGRVPRPGRCSSTPRPAPCCAASTGSTRPQTSRTGSTSRTTRRSTARAPTAGSSAASRPAARPRPPARSTSAAPRRPPAGVGHGRADPDADRDHQTATTPTPGCRR